MTVPPPGGAPDAAVEAVQPGASGSTASTSTSRPSGPTPRSASRRPRCCAGSTAPPTASLEPADYRPLVRELLAHQTLSRRTGSPRLALPPDVHPWVQELAASWVAEIERRGYDVVGDLDDLVGRPAA